MNYRRVIYVVEIVVGSRVVCTICDDTEYAATNRAHRRAAYLGLTQYDLRMHIESLS